MLKRLRQLDELVVEVEVLLLTLITGALVAILMCQVVLRYGFSSPLFWAEEVSVQLLVFLTLIGCSVLLKRRGLIAIDIVTSHLPPRLNRVLSAALQIVGLGIIAFFAYQGTLWILRPEVRSELSPTTQLPIWINYAVLPCVFWLMTFHQFVGLLDLLAGTGERD